MNALFWSHEASLESQRANASVACAFVRERLLDHDLPSLVEDVGLVVHELATLLITQHDQPAFTVLLQGAGGEVLLLTRYGTPQRFERLGGSHATNGYDLHLTGELSERWGVDLARASGGLVWASFAATSPRRGRPVQPPVPLQRTPRGDE